MSLFHLADVELQMIMHCMDAKERLQWSRVNQRLMHAAQSSFAWKHVPMMSIKCMNLASPSLLSLDLDSISLLRFIPLHLLWSKKSCFLLPPLELAGMDSLSSLSSQIHSFDLSLCSAVNPDIFQRLLADPIIKSSLRILIMPHDRCPLDCEKILPVIASLPHLHTLHMPQQFFSSGNSNARDQLISQMTSLTSLSMQSRNSSYWMKVEDYLLPCILATQGRLKHLGLTNLDPTLSGSAFASFFTNECVSGLESLTLDGFNASKKDVSGFTPDFASAFKSLTHLHTMNLMHIEDPIPLITSLSVLSSLGELNVHVWNDSAEIDILPTLTILMESKSNLQCLLELHWTPAFALNAKEELSKLQESREFESVTIKGQTISDID